MGQRDLHDADLSSIIGMDFNIKSRLTEVLQVCQRVERDEEGRISVFKGALNAKTDLQVSSSINKAVGKYRIANFRYPIKSHMKSRYIPVIILLTLTVMKSAFAQLKTAPITGAWQLKEADKEQVLIFQDGFFFHTAYNKEEKRFIYSRGGTFTHHANALNGKISFNSANKEEVGKPFIANYSIAGHTVNLLINGESKNWQRLDDSSAPLAGVWRITSRMQDGKLSPIHQTGTRQTYKILTGTRFQWAAIDPDKKEFSGTGGGVYTFKNGKYIETIEFFSRDSSRVGASLTFDGKLENGEWHHSGRSSKGDPIYEVWSRVR